MIDKPWQRGLNPTYQRMNEDQSKIFVVGTLQEAQEDKEMPEVKASFLIQVLLKRVEVLALPISFTNGALTCILALVDRPGALVILLIDCLNAYEGKRVSAADLADLYPFGFYDMKTLQRYIDTMKGGSGIKWAQLY